MSQPSTKLRLVTVPGTTKPPRRPITTDRQIAALPPAPAPYTVDVNLKLLVTPTARSWRVAYRLYDKRKQIAIGLHPAMTLAEARVAAAGVAKLVKDNIDPVQQRRDVKQGVAAAQALTFAHFAEAWFAEFAPQRSYSWQANNRYWLDSFAIPKLGDRPVATITAPMVKAVMETARCKVSTATAHNVRQTIAAVLKRAMAEGALTGTTNVARELAGVMPKPEVSSHPALPEDRLGEFILVARAYPGSNASTGIALELLLRTALRVSELIEMRKMEVNLHPVKLFGATDAHAFILPHGRVDIPASRMKGRREPHSIPLTPQTHALFAQAIAFAGDSDYVFPGFGTSAPTLSRSAVHRAFERIGFDDYSPHGVRSTFSTLGRDHQLGNGEAIEASLAHVRGSVVERAYNRSALLPPRLLLMQRWDDFLDAQLAVAGSL